MQLDAFLENATDSTRSKLASVKLRQGPPQGAVERQFQTDVGQPMRAEWNVSHNQIAMEGLQHLGNPLSSPKMLGALRGSTGTTSRVHRHERNKGLEDALLTEQQPQTHRRAMLRAPKHWDLHEEAHGS